MILLTINLEYICIHKVSGEELLSLDSFVFVFSKMGSGQQHIEIVRPFNWHEWETRLVYKLQFINRNS